MTLGRFKRFFTAHSVVLLSSLLAPNTPFAQEAEVSVPLLTVRDLGMPEGSNPYFGDSRSTLRAGKCIVEKADAGALTEIL